jgi:RimJ/RimL family protein N-acetyltransferase
MSSLNPLHVRPDVRLGQLEPTHASEMYQWMCDPEVSRNIGLRSKPSMEKTLAWIFSALSDPLIHPFAVFLKDLHVGNIVLDQIDQHYGSARLSVYIGERSARGCGVGTTAMYLALQQGFEVINLHKVWLTVHSQNFRAIRIYSKLGFALEGILRGEFRLGQQRVDTLCMGLFRQNFHRLAVVRSEPDSQS